MCAEAALDVGEPAHALERERRPAVLHVPDDHRREDRERQRDTAPCPRRDQHATRLRVDQHEDERRDRHERHRVLRHHSEADCDAGGEPRAILVVEQRPAQEIQRRGPRRGERCVRRDDHADDEEVGQRAGEQRGAKRRGSSAEVARVERDEDDHHDPARHRGEANEELAGAKLRNRGDQPGDERRVIDVADVGMLRIIPVVRFLRDQLDLSEIDQAQRHEIRDAECDGAAQASLARAIPAGVIAQKQRGSQARDQHAREGRRNDRRERRPMLLNGEQGEDARAQDIREHEHHQHVADPNRRPRAVSREARESGAAREQRTERERGRERQRLRDLEARAGTADQRERDDVRQRGGAGDMKARRGNGKAERAAERRHRRSIHQSIPPAMATNTTSGNTAEKSGGQSFSTPRFENSRPSRKNVRPEHRAGEDPEADAALPALEMRERQREHHHHQHGERVEHLVPERDLEARRLLRIAGQHADVVVERVQLEPLGRDLVDGQDRRPQHGLPHERRRRRSPSCVSRPISVDLHVLELPLAVAAEASRLGDAHVFSRRSRSNS